MIWKTPVSLEVVNEHFTVNMPQFLGIEFTEIGDDYLVAKMPLTKKVQQPYGVLHGGASVVLAETIGSIGGALCIDLEKQKCVGLSINANHVRGVKEGWVFAKGTAVHIGRTTQIWQIEITNESKQLVCTSRLTLAVI